MSHEDIQMFVLIAVSVLPIVAISVLALDSAREQ